MNDNSEKGIDTYRFFQLMSEIEGETALSQRELARRLGIALGLVNSYLKNLLAKGYIRVTTFPRNRFGYVLTPQGLAEKSRLAYQHMSYFTNLYRHTRQDYQRLFRALKRKGIRQVAFCGVDEVAEIAYLSMVEAGLELGTVMDDGAAGGSFFGRPVVSVSIGLLAGNHRIVVSSLKRRDQLHSQLLELGVPEDSIFATD